MLQGFVLDGVPLPVFWFFVGAGIVIQGISKSGFAGGAGILSLPLMMLVMPPTRVTATLLPLLILLDMNAIYHHRHNKDWSKVLAIYIPSLIGIALGALVWWLIGRKGVEKYDDYIMQFTGVIAVVFALYIVAKESALHWVERLHPGPVTTWITGATAGFTSTISHAAGPIVSLYMFTQNLGKSLFVGTIAWTFTLINLTKFPIYFFVDLIDRDILIFDLYLVWLIPIGSYLGKWMHHRVSERHFNYTILVLTLISAVKLIFKVDIVQIALRALY